MAADFDRARLLRARVPRKVDAAVTQPDHGLGAIASQYNVTFAKGLNLYRPARGGDARAGGEAGNLLGQQQAGKPLAARQRLIKRDGDRHIVGLLRQRRERNLAGQGVGKEGLGRGQGRRREIDELLARAAGNRIGGGQAERVEARAGGRILLENNPKAPGTVGTDQLHRHRQRVGVGLCARGKHGGVRTHRGGDVGVDARRPGDGIGIDVLRVVESRNGRRTAAWTRTRADGQRGLGSPRIALGGGDEFGQPRLGVWLVGRRDDGRSAAGSTGAANARARLGRRRRVVAADEIDGRGRVAARPGGAARAARAPGRVTVPAQEVRRTGRCVKVKAGIRRAPGATGRTVARSARTARGELRQRHRAVARMRLRSRDRIGQRAVGARTAIRAVRAAAARTAGLHRRGRGALRE